jgi:hypothetical protein
MQLWGPEFSGVADIDLSIISFTIHFGPDKKSKLDPIDWQQFRASFLPDTAKICTVTVRSGLVRPVQSTDKPKGDPENLGIISPGELVLVTDSMIPSKAARRGQDQQPSDTQLSTEGAVLAFGVGPMGKDTTSFTSLQRIEITYGKERKPAEDRFSFHPITKSAPFALWGDQLSPSVKQPQLVEKLLAGYEIRPLSPPHEPPASQQPWIARAALQSDTPFAVKKDAFGWVALPELSGASLDDPGKRENDIRTAISAAAENRTDIAAALLPGVTIDLGNFDDYDFLEIPQVAAKPESSE